MTDATAGKTLAELDVKPGDVVRCEYDGECGWWTVGHDYVVGGNLGIIDDDGSDIWNPEDGYPIDARFTIISRAAQPADPVKLDDAVPTPLALMAAILEQRRFEAAVAALPMVAETNPNLPGDPANTSLWPDPETLASRRAKWAVLQADALLAALEARHD